MEALKVFSWIKEKIKPTPPWNPEWVWKMWEHKGWGNNIEWGTWKKDSGLQDFHGHYDMSGFLFGSKSTRPTRLKVDHELQAKMQSGKVARFRIVELKYCNDPKDMFFGKANFVDYLE